MTTSKKKDFENIFEGKRSFSSVSSVTDYLGKQKKEQETEDYQQNQWHHILSDNSVPAADLKHILYKVKYDILFEKNQKQRKLLIGISAAAASLLLPLILIFTLNYQAGLRTQNTNKLVELHCPEGTRTKFTLPDGSSGWLAGGSSIAYNLDFNQARSVSVNGEAFFDVRRDPKNEFTVEMNDITVRVLGTQFNVLNYNDDPISEVVVLSGLVQVAGNEKQFQEQLSSNKKLQFQSEENKIVLSNVDASNYTAWKKGRLVFSNENLEEVCRKIKRYYNIEVELNPKDIDNQLFRADIEIGPIDDLLNYMSLALPIKYELINQNQNKTEKGKPQRLIISKK
ncbi:FecR family protein [Sunxiuqinia elliptica]|uniref:FecR family protein n=1 Tax=Sunxiuqinia elliptica TaxID=655355 RepID=A0A1I2G315_9BACT|nr:FecR domain-containing protein [Sunxiuqinia elliptica]SFF12025.1 FecR family protein [Sunxiuqinia elliptica]